MSMKEVKAMRHEVASSSTAARKTRSRPARRSDMWESTHNSLMNDGDCISVQPLLELSLLFKHAFVSILVMLDFG